MLFLDAGVPTQLGRVIAGLKSATGVGCEAARVAGCVRLLTDGYSNPLPVSCTFRSTSLAVVANSIILENVGRCEYLLRTQAPGKRYTFLSIV